MGGYVYACMHVMCVILCVGMSVCVCVCVCITTYK